MKTQVLLLVLTLISLTGMMAISSSYNRPANTVQVCGSNG